MTCDEIDELLSDLLDGELAEGVRAGVEAHVARCTRCTEAYQQLKRTVRFVRANAATPLPPGTPGGVYNDFVRSMMDETFGKDPIEVLVRGAEARSPGSGGSQ